MKRSGCPVSNDSMRAISSARASMASAIAWSTPRRRAPVKSRHSGKALCAARVARATSSSPPRATSLMGELSIGVMFVKASLEVPSVSSPSMKCPSTRSRKRARCASSFATFSCSGWLIVCLRMRRLGSSRHRDPRSRAAGCTAARACPGVTVRE